MRKLMIGIMMVMLMALVPAVMATDVLPAYNENSCVESDGLDYDIKGFAKGSDENTGVFAQYYDTCGNTIGDEGRAKGVYIAETHCSGSEEEPYVHTEWYECENGCFDGACLKDLVVELETPCSDSDGGQNMYVKGIINGEVAPEDGPTEDMCLGDGKVRELYCKDGIGTPKLMACIDGYGCVDGACVPKNVPEQMPTEELPDLSVVSINYDSNNYKAKVCNVGEKPVSNFMVTFQAKDIQNNLYYVPTITPGNCVDIYSWAYSYFGINIDNVQEHYVGVYLDNKGEIKEKEEGNNFYDKPGTNVPDEVVGDETNCNTILVDDCQTVPGGIQVWKKGWTNHHFLENKCRNDPQWGFKDYQSSCIDSYSYNACSKPCSFEEEEVEEVVEDFNYDYEFYRSKLKYGECADPDGGFNPKIKGWAYGYNEWNEGYLGWGDYCSATPEGSEVDEGRFLHEAECLTVAEGGITEVRYQDPIKCNSGCEDGVCLGDGSFEFLDEYEYQEPIDKNNGFVEGKMPEVVEYNDYPRPDHMRPNHIGPIPNEPIIISPGGYCDGCMYDDKCLPIGTKKVNGKPLFCDLDGVFKTQKLDDAYCDNNFECKSNFCSNSKCIDIGKELKETKGLLNRILAWLDKLF
ncbi:hypothetical protein HOC35_02650 [Candidatus Woesearchaeota archaeon]|jgi:hypothetical protein|nr:hypothetical protein [Candidatus Woesearchaeota archaeon]